MARADVPAALRGREVTRPAAPPRAASERPAGTRHYSGVVVVTEPGAVESCARRLDAMDGVEVHLRHVASSRLVAVLEGPTPVALEAKLEQVRAVPGVLMAGLVYHYVDEPTAGEAPASRGVREEQT